MKRCGLLGEKLGHSYSPAIHAELADYAYKLYEVAPDALAAFLTGGDFDALNVTIPYKKAVIPYCAALSPIAQKLGSVNVLVRRPDGTLYGDNADAFGFEYLVRHSGVDIAGKKALVLGNGGASATVQAVLAQLGARVTVISRSGEDNYTNLGRHADAQVIVNTTPVGTYPNNMKSVIELADFPECEAVIDVIYNPFKTALLLEAEKLGLKYTNGLPMLVAQATAAAGYFLGTPGAFQKENQRIIKSMKQQMGNIVLIGMPGTGKSLIGKFLAELTGKTLQDTDAKIEEEAKMTIPEIFEKEGETGFRDRESAICKKLGKERNLIIATGGGAILRPENVDALRQNGTLVHITRSIDKLPTRGRPLSKNIETLKKMEAQRMPLYKAAADITFRNNYTCSRKKLRQRVNTYILEKL